MQTFLPYRSFYLSARSLDKRRCWKQVVEARQILAILGVRLLKRDGSPYNMGKAFRNHPAVLMWENHVEALREYHNTCLKVSKEIWDINTDIQPLLVDEYFYPRWWLDDRLFISHRSNLLRKDSNWYSQFTDWRVPHNLPYYWPVTKDKNYEIPQVGTLDYKIAFEGYYGFAGGEYYGQKY